MTPIAPRSPGKPGNNEAISPQRLPARFLVLAAALIWFVLLGGTELGSLNSGVRAINAALAALVIAYWLWRLPQRADRVDQLVLGALLAFLIACVASDYRRMSFDAATSGLGYAAAFSVARWEVADPRSARAVVTVLAMCGIGLSLLLLPLWGSVLAQWINSTGSVPPLNLILPVGPYRGAHVVGMLFALLLPALIELTRRRIVNVVGFVGIGLSVALIYMSGSRTVWLAVVVGVAAPVLVQGFGRQRVRWAAAIAAAAVVILLVSGALATVISRALTGSTVDLRMEIWGDSLRLWLQDPLFGSGPGSFSAAFTLGGYFVDFERIGRHADNAVIQALMEGGAFGLLAVFLLVVSVLTGVRKAEGRVIRPALAGVAIFVLMSFTDNPSDTANLVIVALCWAALSTAPSERAKRRSWQPSWRTAAIGSGAAAVGAAASLLLVATLAFDESQAAARTGDGRAALHALDRAVTLDPGNALYWRERGLHRAALNRPGASDDLRRAIALVPGDTSAMRGLAVVATRHGDSQLALAAARRAAELRPIHAENLATLAWASLEVGESDTAQRALIELLRRVPWIAASDAWASVFPVDEHLADLQEAARGAWEQHSVSARTAMSLVWANAAVNGPDVLTPNGWTDVPYLLAVDRLLRCDVEGAQVTLVGGHGAADSNLDLRATIMVARVTGDEAAVTEAIALADLWGITDGRLAVGSPPPHSPVWDPDDDRRIYHRAAVVPVNLELVLPTSADGLSAWLRDPLVAARAGAPSSMLASCDR